MPSAAGPGSPSAALAEALDNSSRLIDRHLQDDRYFPDLSELLGVPSHSKPLRRRALTTASKPCLFTINATLLSGAIITVGF